MASAATSRPMQAPSNLSTPPPKTPMSPPKSAPTARNPFPVRSMLDVNTTPPRPTTSSESYKPSGSNKQPEALRPSTSGHQQTSYSKMGHPSVPPIHTRFALNAPEAFQAIPITIPTEHISNETSHPKIQQLPVRQSSSRGTIAKDNATHKANGKLNLLVRAKSFLKRSTSKVELATALQKDTSVDTSRTTSAGDESNVFTLSSNSSHTSNTNSPSSSRSPTDSLPGQFQDWPENDALANSRNAASAASLYGSSLPRASIQWGANSTGAGLQPPISRRLRSASANGSSESREPKIQFQVDSHENEFRNPSLQATFATRAGQGVGLKSRRLSVTVPDGFVVFPKVLSEDYRSTRLFRTKGGVIGKGSTATVRIMVRRHGGKKNGCYAVKEYRGKDKDETREEWEQKIKSEYTLANSVNHPNIVRTFDLCIDKYGHYNHVMDYCPIEFFNLAERGLFKSFYTVEDRLCFFKQVLRAVDYLHAHGIAHRDIKLENILMDAKGHLKLTDFGVSEVFSGVHPGACESGGQCGLDMGETRLSPPGICGSMPYISPEVMGRKEQYDPTKLDSWSCGVLWLTLACSGSLWMRPDEEECAYYATFMSGWRTWLEEHGDRVPNETTGYPKCGRFMTMAGPPGMKKIMLKLMHPNPDKRLSVHDALNNPYVKNIKCCSPESLERCVFDASTNCKSRPMETLYKHNHIPSKRPKVRLQTFHMNDS